MDFLPLGIKMESRIQMSALMAFHGKASHAKQNHFMRRMRNRFIAEVSRKTGNTIFERMGNDLAETFTPAKLRRFSAGLLLA